MTSSCFSLPELKPSGSQLPSKLPTSLSDNGRRGNYTQFEKPRNKPVQLASGNGCLTKLTKCNNGFTVDFWFKVGNPTQWTDSVLVSTGGHMADTQGYAVRHFGDGGYYYIQVVVRSATNYWHVEFKVDMEMEWTHLIFSWSKNHGLKADLNGVIQASVTTEQGQDTSSKEGGKLYISGWGTSDFKPAVFDIDELHIFDERLTLGKFSHNLTKTVVNRWLRSRL